VEGKEEDSIEVIVWGASGLGYGVGKWLEGWGRLHHQDCWLEPVEVMEST